MEKPLTTIIVIFYNMRREARRTLFTLTAGYQRGVTEDQFEVVAVDNGSDDPLSAAEVTSFGRNFHYHLEEDPLPSPARALNRAIRRVETPYVTCMIDGARMLSPGVLLNTFSVLRAFDEPFVYSLGMHLGAKIQNESLLEGYDQAAEDRLLAPVPWRDNGYRLFTVSALSIACRDGFFSPIEETTCFTMRRDTLLNLGGFNESFILPGGGVVNQDIFKVITESGEVEPVMLLGEATFHQFHGGVATNVSIADHPIDQFREEYRRVRGVEYVMPTVEPLYWGRISEETRQFVVR